jgi:hypothetical protein
MLSKGGGGVALLIRWVEMGLFLGWAPLYRQRSLPFLRLPSGVLLTPRVLSKNNNLDLLYMGSFQSFAY